jgi:hypothetical protein
MKISELVEKYIKIRDRKTQLKKEYEAKVAPLEDAHAKIEAKFLELFEKSGTDSLKTEFGTAYKSTRTSITVADREAFMTYIRENDEWPLLEIRPAKAAVESFKESHEDIPPGLNYREEMVVNFRRAS